MSESNTHRELVKVAYEYVQNCVQPELRSLICADLSSTTRPSKVVGNYIPDILFWHDALLIVGEAKTKNDFLRNHSQQQYKAYLDECKNFYGKAMLIVSVPWDMTLTAKNYFRRLKNNSNYDVEIIVINELGKAMEI